MEEKPFRVLLDFSEVNTGTLGLKYVWMHVSPRELNTIYDFKQTIIRKFSFTQDSFKLFVRDGLLLETEKIAILREDDIIKLQLETSMECSTAINISAHQLSCYSLQSNAPGVGLSKPCKRKSETFTTLSREIENGSPPANRSKKKKKQDNIEYLPDESTNFSVDEQNDSLAASTSKKKKRQDKIEYLPGESANFSVDEENDSLAAGGSKKKKKQAKDKCMADESVDMAEEPSNTISLENLDKNSKSNASNNNKQVCKGKNRPYPKIATSEFINFAMKLSELERKNQNASQSAIRSTNSIGIKDSITDTNLYKTAEITSITNLSPIFEQSAYELSNSKTPLNLTESFDMGKSQVDSKSSICEDKAENTSSRKRRRRNRKKKMVANDDDNFSEDVNTETGGSFLTDVNSNETYNTSSNARKHIIFHSPPPPQINTTVILESNPDSSCDDPKRLPIEVCKLKSDVEFDSSVTKSLTEDSQLDTKAYTGSELANSETESCKESTPFANKKLKGKSWSVTPLPRISSSSHFSEENSDISRSDNSKPAYQDYTPLNCLPPVGTRLAYKVLELNEDYCPEVTEYKEGIIRKVNPNTDELEIELIQEEIKPGRSGKFENLWNDEPLPGDQIIKMVSLNWSALIDPRLIP